jgi:hypothetical protein
MHPGRRENPHIAKCAMCGAPAKSLAGEVLQIVGKWNLRAGGQHLARETNVAVVNVGTVTTGGAPFLALFEKWAATETDTAAALVLRSRPSNLHLQHFPVVHFTVCLKAYPDTNHRPSFTSLVGPAIDVYDIDMRYGAPTHSQTTRMSGAPTPLMKCKSRVRRVSYLSDAISITKRYFTSLFASRS